MNRAAAYVLPLALEDAIAPEADPSVRAVWQSLYAQRHPDLNLEQALLDPNLRRGILNAALYRERKLAKRAITPHKDD